MSDTTSGAKPSDRLREAASKARDTLNEQIVEPARRAGEAMRASGQKWAEGNAKISLTLIDQAERNVHEAFAAMRQAAQAKDLSEVVTIQSDYLRHQGARAMEQARQIGDMILQVGRETATPMRGAAEASAATATGGQKPAKPSAAKPTRKG